MKRIGFLVLFLVITSCLFVPLSHAKIIVVDSYSETNRNTDYPINILHPSGVPARMSAIYQGFTETINSPVNLTSTTFYLKKVGLPIGNLTAVLYAHGGNYGVNGIPNGAALATSDIIPMASLTGASTLTNFTFSTPYSMQPGIKYVVALQAQAVTLLDAGNCVNVGVDTAAPTHSGNGGGYIDGGWDPIGGGVDTVFYVESNVPDDWIKYQFTDTYYENGTLATPSINVSVSADGYSDEFNTSGGKTRYYTPEPTTFYWDIGGGLARYVHSFGSENITVTIPDDTDYIYSFTVKDYTSKTPAYLEAYRTINGSETLIERMPVQQPNMVPFNLVYGKTYHLKILFTDGTRYDWGYFVAAGTTELTLIIRTVEFSDQLQPLYGTIFVEATRNTVGTTITVDYNDTRTNTVWGNVSIRVRNGAVIFTAARNNDSYTLNWASANASLGYIITVSGDHSDFGEWGYVKIFDETESFPDAPDLTGIFDFGLGPNLGAWMLTVTTIIGFSKAMQGRSILAGMVMATMLRYIGWATWDYNFIIFGWFFTIVAMLAMGGNE